MDSPRQWDPEQGGEDPLDNNKGPAGYQYPSRDNSAHLSAGTSAVTSLSLRETQEESLARLANPIGIVSSILVGAVIVWTNLCSGGAWAVRTSAGWRLTWLHMTACALQQRAIPFAHACCTVACAITLHPQAGALLALFLNPPQTIYSGYDSAEWIGCCKDMPDGTCYRFSVALIAFLFFACCCSIASLVFIVAVGAGGGAAWQGLFRLYI